MAMAGDAGDTSEDAGVDPGINVCIEPYDGCTYVADTSVDTSVDA